MKAIQSNQMCILVCTWALMHYWALSTFPSIKAWLGKGWQKKNHKFIHHLGLSSPLHFLHFFYPYHGLATCVSPFFGLSHSLLVYSFYSHNHQSAWKLSAIQQFLPALLLLLLDLRPTFLCWILPLKPDSFSALHSLDQKPMYMKAGRETGKGKEKGKQEGNKKKVTEQRFFIFDYL